MPAVSTHTAMPAIFTRLPSPRPDARPPRFRGNARPVHARPATRAPRNGAPRGPRCPGTGPRDRAAPGHPGDRAPIGTPATAPRGTPATAHHGATPASAHHGATPAAADRGTASPYACFPVTSRDELLQPQTTDTEAEAGYRQHRFVTPPGATELLLIRHGESQPAFPGPPFPLTDGRADPGLRPTASSRHSGWRTGWPPSASTRSTSSLAQADRADGRAAGPPARPGPERRAPAPRSRTSATGRAACTASGWPRTARWSTHAGRGALGRDPRRGAGGEFAARVSGRDRAAGRRAPRSAAGRRSPTAASSARPWPWPADHACSRSSAPTTARSRTWSSAAATGRSAASTTPRTWTLASTQGCRQRANPCPFGRPRAGHRQRRPRDQNGGTGPTGPVSGSTGTQGTGTGCAGSSAFSMSASATGS